MKVSLKINALSRLLKKINRSSSVLLVITCVLAMTACVPETPVTTPAESSTTSTYYVSESGSDTNSGGESAPWATLQHAADTVVAGDTVIIEHGSYAGFQATTTGTSGSPITFKANTGALVVINDSYAGAVSTDSYVELIGVSYWMLEDFYVLGSDWHGVYVEGDEEQTIGASITKSYGVELSGITVIDSHRSGAYLQFAEDALVENSVIAYNGYNGIHFKADGDNPVIQYNTVFESDYGGIQVNGAEDFGGDGMMANATLEYNRIFENGLAGSGGGIGLDGVEDSSITFNDLYHNGSMGIDIFQMDGADGLADTIFTNNVISQSSGSDNWGVRIACMTCVTNVSFISNSIYHADIAAPSSAGAMSVPSSSFTAYMVSDNNYLADLLSYDGTSGTFTDLSGWQTYFDSGSTLITTEPSAGTATTVLDGSYDYYLYETSTSDYAYRGYGAVTFTAGEMTARTYDTGCGVHIINSSSTTIDTNTGEHYNTHNSGCSAGSASDYIWDIVSTDGGDKFVGKASTGPMEWYVIGIKQ